MKKSDLSSSLDERKDKQKEKTKDKKDKDKAKSKTKLPKEKKDKKPPKDLVITSPCAVIKPVPTTRSPSSGSVTPTPVTPKQTPAVIATPTSPKNAGSSPGFSFRPSSLDSGSIKPPINIGSRKPQIDEKKLPKLDRPGSPRKRSATSFMGFDADLTSPSRPAALTSSRSHPGSHLLLQNVNLKQYQPDPTINLGSGVTDPDYHFKYNILRGTKSEPFLHSWDYTVIQTYQEPLSTLKSSLKTSTSKIAGHEPKENRELKSLVEEEDEDFDDIKDDHLQKHPPKGGKKTIFSEDEEDHNEAPPQFIDYEGKHVLFGATLRYLIKLFAGNEITDNEYIHTFLITHNYFIDSHILFDKLVERYNVKLSQEFQSTEEKEEFVAILKNIRLRIVKVMKTWIENTSLDFRSDPVLVSKCTAFFEQLKGSSDKGEVAWGNMLSKALTQAGTKVKTMFKGSEDLRPLLPVNVKNRDLVFLDFHPLEVARQLSLIDHAMFKQLKQREFFRCAWSKKNKHELAPNVLEIADRFTKLSLWIVTEIVTTANPHQRVTVLSRFIQIAEHLDKMNNFHGLMAIFVALNMGPVRRLKSTWKRVPEKYMKKMSEIEEFFSHNYKLYRARLMATPPPRIPFLVVFLSDLTLLEESTDSLEGGLINFQKMRLLTKSLGVLDTSTSVDYYFYPVSFIQEYLQTNKLMVKTENDLYAISKLIEASDAENKKIAGKKFRGLGKSKGGEQVDVDPLNFDDYIKNEMTKSKLTG